MIISVAPSRDTKAKAFYETQSRGKLEKGEGEEEEEEDRVRKVHLANSFT